MPERVGSSEGLGSTPRIRPQLPRETKQPLAVSVTVLGDERLKRCDRSLQRMVAMLEEGDCRCGRVRLSRAIPPESGRAATAEVEAVPARPMAANNCGGAQWYTLLPNV